MFTFDHGMGYGVSIHNTKSVHAKQNPDTIAKEQLEICCSTSEGESEV